LLSSKEWGLALYYHFDENHGNSVYDQIAAGGMNTGELIIDSCTTTDDSSYQCGDETFCNERGCCNSRGKTTEAKKILRCPKDRPYLCKFGNGLTCNRKMGMGCDVLVCSALADGSVGRASGGARNSLMPTLIEQLEKKETSAISSKGNKNYSSSNAFSLLEVDAEDQAKAITSSNAFNLLEVEAKDRAQAITVQTAVQAAPASEAHFDDSNKYEQNNMTPRSLLSKRVSDTSLLQTKGWFVKTFCRSIFRAYFQRK
jgi:hypothetical protein